MSGRRRPFQAIHRATLHRADGNGNVALIYQDKHRYRWSDVSGAVQQLQSLDSRSFGIADKKMAFSGLQGIETAFCITEMRNCDTKLAKGRLDHVRARFVAVGIEHVRRSLHADSPPTVCLLRVPHSASPTWYRRQAEHLCTEYQGIPSPPGFHLYIRRPERHPARHAPKRACLARILAIARSFCAATGSASATSSRKGWFPIWRHQPTIYARLVRVCYGFGVRVSTRTSSIRPAQKVSGRAEPAAPMSSQPSQPTPTRSVLSAATSVPSA